MKQNYNLTLSFRQLQALHDLLDSMYIYDCVNTSSIPEDTFEKLKSKVDVVFDDIYER